MKATPRKQRSGKAGSSARRRAPLARYLSRKRTVELTAASRKEAFEELAKLVAADCRDVSAEQIVAAVTARENALSTRVSGKVAIPHAVLPTRRTWMAFGRSRGGLAWDRSDPQPVHLVALIIGPRSEHLRATALLASHLTRPSMSLRLLEAPDTREVFRLLTDPSPPPREQSDPERERISRDCFRQALLLAECVQAHALLLHVDAMGHLDFLDFPVAPPPRLLVVTGDPARYPSPPPRVTRIVPLPFSGHDRGGLVDVALLYAVSQGALHPADRVVSVCGIPGSGLLDTVRVADLAWEYRHFLGLKEKILPRDLEQHVLLRALQMAALIAQEGREGDAVGTLFVVGDFRNVKRHCRQMIINPFFGCGDGERNLLDPALEETVKEFARLDGAFVVQGDGRIHSAGTYLRADGSGTVLPPGLGARHGAAAAISAVTGALAVVVSQSTRRVRLFKNGRCVLMFQP